jgi:hypothetical protein
MGDFSGGGGPDQGSVAGARNNQRGQRGTTADRSGGPGDRKRELPPPPAKIPGIPSEVDPKYFKP